MYSTYEIREKEFSTYTLVSIIECPIMTELEIILGNFKGNWEARWSPWGEVLCYFNNSEPIRSIRVELPTWWERMREITFVGKIVLARCVLQETVDKLYDKQTKMMAARNHENIAAKQRSYREKL